MPNSVLFRSFCRLLIVALLAGPMAPAMAGMIGTERAIAPASSLAQRSTVIAMLDRSDVATQLQSQGVDPMAAKARVASMTDAEIASIAGQVDAAPAGAASGWAIAAVVALVVWYLYMH